MSELASWVAAESTNWQRRRIRTIGSTVSGSGFPPALQGEVGLDLPFYKVKHLGQASPDGIMGDAEDTVSYQTAKSLGATIFPAGTLVYAKVGAALMLGRVRVLPVDACLDNNMAGLTPFSEVLPRFLFWAMSQVKFDYLVNPGAVPSLSDKNLLAFPLLVPSRDEQQAIASFLDRETARIDTLIKEQQRLIDMLRERRADLISHAVLDVTAERTQLRRLVDVVDCAHVTAEFVDDDHRYPVASIRECQGATVDLSECNYTTAGFFEHLRAADRAPRSGDLLFIRNVSVGLVSVVSHGMPEFAMGQETVLLRRKRNVDPFYLRYALLGAEVRHAIEGVIIGSTFRRINVSAVRSLRVPVPKLDEQHRVVAYLDDETARIDALIAEAERFVELSKERRAALITAAVTGQIDVREMV